MWRLNFIVDSRKVFFGVFRRLSKNSSRSANFLEFLEKSHRISAFGRFTRFSPSKFHCTPPRIANEVVVYLRLRLLVFALELWTFWLSIFAWELLREIAAPHILSSRHRHYQSHSVTQWKIFDFEWSRPEPIRKQPQIQYFLEYNFGCFCFQSNSFRFVFW